MKSIETIAPSTEIVKRKLKYKIRERFYAIRKEVNRSAVRNRICNMCDIKDYNFRIWMNVEVDDTFEIPLKKLNMIALCLGCDWIDLLNDEMREDLERNDY